MNAAAALTGEPQSAWRRLVLPVALLLAVLGAGTYVRLVDLGKPDFHEDELNHVYAAAALGRGAGAVLPSGEPYRRGLDVTWLVGHAMRVIEPPETAARLPSALFGVLDLVGIAAIAWAMAGPWAGVWAALLFGIYPEAIYQTRQTRFYTYQLAFGLLAFWAGWRALRTAGSMSPTDRTTLRREWTWVLLTLAAFGLATRVQPTTLPVAFAWSLALVIAAVADLKARGRAAWWNSGRVQAAALLATAAVLVVLLRSDVVAMLVDRSRFVPDWVGDDLGGALTYYWALSAQFPVLLALFPVCLAATALRDPRLALYLAIWFGVPLALHSLVLPAKAERYLLLAMPAFLIAGAIAASLGCAALYKRTLEFARTLRLSAIAARTAAGSIVACAALFAILSTPALHAARKEPLFFKDLRWRAALDAMQVVPDRDSLAFGSSYPIGSLYYWNRVDFGVTTSGLRTRAPLVTDSTGVADFYSGVPIVTRPEAIRDRFARASGAVIAIDRAHWSYDRVDPALKQVLSSEAKELCRGDCGRLLLFYWPMRQPEPAVAGSVEPIDSPAVEDRPTRRRPTSSSARSVARRYESE